MLKYQEEKQGAKQTGASRMQQKAICHVTGPAGVLAGPGSGKTFTIIQRLNYLVNTLSVSPDKILCVTFTKAAAMEMQERYHKQCFEKLSANEEVCFGTIHSICFHILKESGNFRNYSLIKESQKRKIMEMLLSETVHSDSHPMEKYILKEQINYSLVSDMLDAVSRKKNGLSYHQDDVEESCFAQIFSRYQEAMCERRLMDFDDMIENALHLLTDNVKIRKKWQEKFLYLLVDEFQDVNEMQYQIIKLLAMPHNNLFVVGDDDQAIYGFRGAAPNIMQQFFHDYPRAALLYLTENFRCKEEIISFANRVISKNTERIDKQTNVVKKGGIVHVLCVETCREEEALLLKEIRNLSSKDQEQCAVIVRTNREAAHYSALLKANHIPVMTTQKENLHIFSHFIRDDFDAFLRFCMEGRKRNDFLKIMNKPERYLSPHALKNETVKEEDLLAYYFNNTDMCKKISDLFKHIRRVELMPFSVAIRYYRNVMKYDDYLREKATSLIEESEYKKIADKLLQLYQAQKQKESIEDFWKRMESETEIATRAEMDKQVTKGVSIITMHGAKGLEFSHVFLPDVNDGIIPQKQCKTSESIEEERRLLYVAITRACDSLTIYYTKERGRNASRFITELIPHQ